MHTSRRIASSAFLALAALAALGAAANPLDPPRWTVDDILLAEHASSWEISPDGTLAVWVRATVEKVGTEEKRVSNLWLSRLSDGTSVALTRGQDTVSAPAFSPDSRHIAFLSTRKAPGAKPDDEKGKNQLWAIPVAGGEAFAVTRFDRDVSRFGWVGPAALVVAAQESPSQWDRERKERGDDATVVDDAEHEPPVRLFRVALDGGKTERLTRNADWIDALAVSPDGTVAVVTAQQSLSWEFDQRVPPQTFLVDLATGARTRIFEDAKILPQLVRWAPDGTGFYLVNQFSRHPRYREATINELYWFDIAAKTVEKVDLGWERGLEHAYAPTVDGVVALLADGVHPRAARLVRTAKGWRRQDLAGTHAGSIEEVELGRDGRTLVYATSTATQPTQWYSARVEGARIVGERKLTDLNPSWRGKPTGKVEVVRWKGARGDEVEGLLHYPLDWREGARAPLVLAIHGGPAGADHDRWEESWAYPLLLWRQRGAFVLQVNYHGSADYGLDWVESIAGHYYELEVPDIEAGVDDLVRRGLVDPDRLGTTGWSNGGILSAALITTATRYKAASVGAADVEWFSDWANVDFGASFDNYYFGGAPWEVPQAYMEKSPFFRVAKVTTPTIVYTGTDDRNVPPHESWSLFRALQQIGAAPVRFLTFPGEPHSLRKIAHQRRKVEEDLAWFDRYLFGKPPAPGTALKEGSPLAGLLERARAARSGSAFGRLEKGALVPETVRFQDLEVGRFEVTRAQFAAFDRTVAFTAATADLPMTGVAFDRARAYAAWLGTHTGRPFRLPTEDEARNLARAAGTGGNTLDRWAGYAPNPDDSARLLEAAKTLAGDAPLLLPVGTLPGTGDDAVFDLDGNAAEWAVAAGGAGVAVGPSADRPADARGAGAPSLAYTGLRVVVDAGP
ncbi:MAG TPA: prolyl oligopeptidase family serine peptidase [Thermoanaerobaculaceae bacterium]|nr:prolyl oligopeptidase family serine peptidase [Thermoanaerobaculaceae bacterium]